MMSSLQSTVWWNPSQKPIAEKPLLKQLGDFPGSPVVKDSWLPLQAAWVQPLVGELRSHMLHGAAKFFFFLIKKKKLSWKCKGLIIGKTTLRKNKAASIKTHYKASAINTELVWDRWTDLCRSSHSHTYTGDWQKWCRSKRVLLHGKPPRTWPLTPATHQALQMGMDLNVKEKIKGFYDMTEYTVFRTWG